LVPFTSTGLAPSKQLNGRYVKIHFYKLTADNGGAPCVHRGLLSLAICKPMIRKTAKEGDLIFGFAANSLSQDNRLIYVARITDKPCDGAYYTSDRYSRRGDCIYEFKNGRFARRKRAKHHLNPKDLIHDLGRRPYSKANVLLSTDFRYFGKAGTDDYKSKFRRVKYAVERLRRGHRVHQNAELRDQLLDMRDWIWRTATQKKIGQPTSAPSGETCHREGPCGIT
jgi:hypothetical protein